MIFFMIWVFNHTVVGNHTAYYKDTNEINTIDLLLKHMIILQPTQRRKKLLVILVLTNTLD